MATHMSRFSNTINNQLSISWSIKFNYTVMLSVVELTRNCSGLSICWKASSLLSTRLPTERSRWSQQLIDRPKMSPFSVTLRLSHAPKGMTSTVTSAAVTWHDHQWMRLPPPTNQVGSVKRQNGEGSPGQVSQNTISSIASWFPAMAS